MKTPDLDMTLDALGDPDWDSPLQVTLTPDLLVHALMETATSVHTGWQSCVQEESVLNQLVVMDDSATNAIRLVEQEFSDEQEQAADADAVWHDWTLEIRLGKIFTIGHWQLRGNAPPLDWEWHARQAEQAFERACLLLGRRVRRGLWVEDPLPRDLPPRASRH